MYNAITILGIFLCLCGVSKVEPAGESQSVTEKFSRKWRNRRQQDLLGNLEFFNHLNKRNKKNYDARAEEGWWVLYPFGKSANDLSLKGRGRRGRRIDLGFQLPFYGFRYNYATIFPTGLVSFSPPSLQRYPKRFPVSQWPYNRDPSFIAAYYADSEYIVVDGQQISTVWYRTVKWQHNKVRRSIRKAEQKHPKRKLRRSGRGGVSRSESLSNSKLLRNITQIVRSTATGASGWTARHALLVTWEMMAYGGAASSLRPEEFVNEHDKLNTFQLVLATDQVTTYAMFNYAALNWTTSNAAGGHNGFGGKQSAIVGFNGGNNTGWTPLPHSGHGSVWKLREAGNSQEKGRWIYRIDENILEAGCSSDFSGDMTLSPNNGPVQGGFLVNISGPCFNIREAAEVSIGETTVPCQIINSRRAQFVFPKFVNSMGWTDISFSRARGKHYSGQFYINAPALSATKVWLVDDQNSPVNQWNNSKAEELSLVWQHHNLTYDQNARVDIKIYGFWENSYGENKLEFLDYIAANIPNNGKYRFRPRTLIRKPQIKDAWKKAFAGLVQVSMAHATDGRSLWSKVTPLYWYFLPAWTREYGRNSSIQICNALMKSDRSMGSFVNLAPCPCDMYQADVDIGRFLPITTCDRNYDFTCPYHMGATHCVQSVIHMKADRAPAQQCCYDAQGYLLFSQDVKEGNGLSPGTPVRSHSLGTYTMESTAGWAVPTLSHYLKDIAPHEFCCNAGRCDLFYQNRKTDGCQKYKPVGLAYAFGVSHFATFDGKEYTFPGRGYFGLVQTPDLSVQVRLEQPQRTAWNAIVNATVITGVAIKEKDSDLVEVYARKPLRRWRYATDVFVNNDQRFFDEIKFQQLTGVTVSSPTANQSELIVSLGSGAGVRVHHSNGMLDVMVSLPDSFRITCDVTEADCSMTQGLLGTFNDDPTDDFMTPHGNIVNVEKIYSVAGTRQLYREFGMKYQVSAQLPESKKALFNKRQRPIYDPVMFFTMYDYRAMMHPSMIPLAADGIFTKEEVLSTCRENQQCYYDYMVTGRKTDAINTLNIFYKFLDVRDDGTQNLISCGPLQTNPGVIKMPPSPNYLDGDSTEFSCELGFRLSGDEVRTCLNGTWTEGEEAFCTKIQPSTTESTEQNPSVLTRPPGNNHGETLTENMFLVFSILFVLLLC